MAEGDCGKAEKRFYYEVETNRCLEFLYGGCGGNLNNFISLSDCQEFCRGAANDDAFLQKTLFDENGNVLKDLFVVGFVLSGPLARQKHTESFNKFVFFSLTFLLFKKKF